MRHPDPEELASLALGDPTDAAIPTHVSRCGTCDHEVQQLRDVVSLSARLGGEHLVLERPPDRVWSAILAETRQPLLPSDAPRPAVPPRWRHLAGVVAGFAVGVAATLAGVLVIGNATASQPVRDERRTIAQGVVSPYAPSSSTSGSVTVLQGRDQRRSMRIELNRAPRTSSEFVEAWLLDPRNNDMISLGVMGGRTQTFPLPEGVDLKAYTSVDISLEPFDGDPQHSATSLARGAITGS